MNKIDYKSTLHACYLGYITQALIVNLPPLLFVVFRDKFGLSYTMLGSVVMLIFITQLIVDALAIKFVDKIGQRMSAVIAHAFVAVGMVALAFLPRFLPSPFMGIVIANILYSIGGGLIEVLVSPIVESLPGDAKASSMSLLHSFIAGAGFGYCCIYCNFAFCWSGFMVLPPAFVVGIAFVYPFQIRTSADNAS
jgi:MFS family permease